MTAVITFTTASVVSFLFIKLVTLGQQRGAVRRLSALIRELRWLLEGPLEVRQLTAADVGLHERRAELDALSDECRRAGMSELGELVYDYSNTSFATLGRHFVDASRRISVFVGVASVTKPDRADPSVIGLTRRSSKKRRVMIEMTTHADTEWFKTLRDLGPGVLNPPELHWNRVAANADVSAMLASHRSFTAVVNVDRVHEVPDLEECCREGLREHDVRATWRRAQDPRQLLEDDVRRVLGKHFHRLGRHVIRRLERSIPPARAL